MNSRLPLSIVAAWVLIIVSVVLLIVFDSVVEEKYVIAICVEKKGDIPKLQRGHAYMEYKGFIDQVTIRIGVFDQVRVGGEYGVILQTKRSGRKLFQDYYLDLNPEKKSQ